MKSGNDFTMLVNFSTGSDSAVLSAVEKPVLCKLSYCPPYEAFTGLKKIQLAVRRKDIFERKQITLSIDISEWIGHEDEEYFTSFLRFLYDHRNGWKYIFVVNCERTVDVRDVYLAVRYYLRGRLVMDNKWHDAEKMKSYLHQVMRFDRPSAALFADFVLSEVPKKCHTDEFIRVVSEEIKTASGHPIISTKDFRDYVKDPVSMVALMLPSNALESLRNKTSEKEYADVRV